MGINPKEKTSLEEGSGIVTPSSSLSWPGAFGEHLEFFRAKTQRLGTKTEQPQIRGAARGSNEHIDRLRDRRAVTGATGFSM